MSRGRHHNALHLAEADPGRDEVAPRETHLRAPRDRLIATLERSEASSLAIDGARAAEVRPEQVVVPARRSLDAARARRAAHELDRAEGRER
jgi:hypothetical protein